MTTDEMIAKIEALSAEDRAALRAVMGLEVDAAEQQEVVMEDVQPKAEKVKCKVCGFAKKSRRVTDGVCKSCRTALDSDEPEVEVVGRMGKRGRNTVSVVIDGQRFRVKRLSSKHSERIAAKYASKGKGYAKRGKRTGGEPSGLPTNSRIGGDREQRTYED